ncbi:MAG: hypothetical protein LBR75_05780 [Prevotellaceae bacterium]|jgi:hypothetical protein|nr:hypothetical protein [Prevotellaceae bacterium]
MEQKINESYTKIWKHLADKYNYSGDLTGILKEKSLHLILMRYFSHLSETEKTSLTNELRAMETKFGVPESKKL